MLAINNLNKLAPSLLLLELLLGAHLDIGYTNIMNIKLNPTIKLKIVRIVGYTF